MKISPRWENPGTVAGFRRGKPNDVLLAYARGLRSQGSPTPRALDLGCGAARNAIPLAELGFDVVGVDLSAPMIDAARARAEQSSVSKHLAFVLGPMAPLPFADGSFDLVVAQGIWNLARSGREFRAALAEGARVARPGAGLFLFTFSRHTLPETAQPVVGEAFVFDQFSGEPQCFLAEQELLTELGRVGFVREPDEPLTEYNRPGPNTISVSGPVIWEGTFVRRA